MLVWGYPLSSKAGTLLVLYTTLSQNGEIKDPYFSI